METIKRFNEQIRQMALQQDNEKMNELVRKRNEYIFSYKGTTRLEMMNFIQEHDEKLYKSIEKIKDEMQEYILTQVAKKRATRKYDQY